MEKTWLGFDCICGPGVLLEGLGCVQGSVWDRCVMGRFGLWQRSVWDRCIVGRFGLCAEVSGVQVYCGKVWPVCGVQCQSGVL